MAFAARRNTMEDLILAIDAGTTGIRAILFDAESHPVAESYREFRQIYPAMGLLEHDPLEIWNTVLHVVQEILPVDASIRLRIKAVGVTNQRSTIVVWDKRTGNPVYNAIVWQDIRTYPRAMELQQMGVLTNILASSTKLEWILQNVAGAREMAQAGHLLCGTVDTWLVWKMTGGRAHVTDPSNASATGLFDPETGTWNRHILELMGIPASLLPEIRPSAEIYGLTDPDVLGIRVPVSGIAGDQQAAMFGQTCFQPGDMKATFGTSMMLDVNVGTTLYFPDAQIYPMALWKLGDRTFYCFEGTVVSAGAAIQWLRDGLGLFRDYSEIPALIQSVKDHGGVVFVPALQGLGSPYMDFSVKANIDGLTRGTTKGHIIRATLEGIAFRTWEVVESVTSQAQIRNNGRLRVDGGLARSDYLLQFLANVTGLVVERPNTLQATALGAAYLAGLASGVWKNTEEVAAAWKSGGAFYPATEESTRSRMQKRWKDHIRRIYGLEK
jgi:glycerol kinase